MAKVTKKAVRKKKVDLVSDRAIKDLDDVMLSGQTLTQTKKTQLGYLAYRIEYNLKTGLPVNTGLAIREMDSGHIFMAIVELFRALEDSGQSSELTMVMVMKALQIK